MSRYRFIPLTGRAYESLKEIYATRAIESGMQPKTLQKLLGHASLKTTMDRYVHVTDDSMEMGVRLFEQGQLEKGLAAENVAEGIMKVLKPLKN